MKKAPNPPPTVPELASLALRGYVEVRTTGDGIMHNGVVDKLSVKDHDVIIDREVSMLHKVDFVMVKLKV